jgi:stringent starvation protein B
MADVTSKLPYLLRSMHEWMCDNNLTPHIVVDASAEGIVVPAQYIEDGRIVLNVSGTATRSLSLGDDRVTFETRFGGVAQQIDVPTTAVVGIYAQENGQGMIFSDDDSPSDKPEQSQQSGSDRPSGKPALKVVK